MEVFFTLSLFGISLLYWGVVGGVFRQSIYLYFRTKISIDFDIVLSFWCNNGTKLSIVILLSS